MIGPNHPVRELFADCSTGSNGGRYYVSKDEAYYAFNTALLKYDYFLESRLGLGNSGSETIIIRDDCMDLVGRAYFSWYRMPSGRWEVIGYIT